MNGISEPLRTSQNALWAMRNTHGFRKARVNRVRDCRRNFLRDRHNEKYMPEKCHALVDKKGEPHMYMMMTHDEAKEKNKTAVAIGLRWTLGQAPNGEVVKTK